ncbi:MAG: spermidine/putrescine ABC transporter permease PotC [Gammaproteobacteria bacterium GWE2_42_36]|nr:MAG: spermidine/putrescine ABC transporter permease PotC [Gammaproteobacteria bacterium GWE2_42_36]
MKNFLKTSYIASIYVFLYLPVIVLIAYAFNNARFSAEWHGMTLQWFTTLFQDTDLLVITAHSLIIAVLSATIAVILGALGSVALFRYYFFGKQFIHGLLFVLIVVPDLVFGISLLILYSLAKIHLGFWSLLLAHVTFCLPFVVVTVLGRLSGTDKKIIEAARDLGATDSTIFFKIILPLMLPALVAGWLLSFTLSMDDVIISFFVSGPNFQILPLYIFSQVHVGITPEINALCTLVFLLTVLFVCLAHFLLKKRA